ncbi:hypothetical protein IFM89_028257 [Coptis chinensis]|uniref:Uncharacterized protein n=1 Tax=Coptis chinensis TaxID=261450 RepID=A0A835MCA5_9MAGN|nr:hypothetical protein IFM89_028257 [Coptis chinensis]
MATHGRGTATGAGLGAEVGGAAACVVGSDNSTIYVQQRNLQDPQRKDIQMVQICFHFLLYRFWREIGEIGGDFVFHNDELIGEEVELKKRILSTVSLVNNTDQYVAFKNSNTVLLGVNVVIMEAQWVSPLGMKCKDKFLIQSTIVFSGTKEEEITSRLVAMDMKVLKDVQELKQDVEELNITKDVGDGRVAKAEGESKLARDIEELKLKLRKVEAKLNEVGQSSAVTSHFQANLMGGLNWLERVLVPIERGLHLQDESIITRLREDRHIAATESQKLIPEPAILETQIGQKEIQVDFLFLFVCVMALISLELGFQLLGS